MVSSDPRIQSQVGGAFGSFIGLGDYLGLVAARGKAHMFWADTRRGKQDVFYGQIDFSSAPPPPDGLSGDSCQSPRIIGSLPFQDTFDTRLATSSADDPVSCSGTADTNTVWYALTVTADTLCGIETTSSDYDTVVSVYSGACGALTRIACNDDFGNPPVSANRSVLTFPAAQGVAYLIEASGKGSGGLLKIRVGYPTITLVEFVRAPQDALFITGASFTRNAAVTVQSDGEDIPLPTVFSFGPPGFNTAALVYATKKKLKKLVNRGSLLVRLESPVGSGNISNSFLFTR